MKELTCIGCPRGCTLKIERGGDGWSVTGNTCPRGKEFAISEMTAPKRTICSTVRTAFPDAPVLPVRRMACLPPDCLLMELASAPGGYEQAAAKRLGLRTVTAPGLPARCCPQEAGDAYGQAILNVLEEDP